MPSPPAPSSSGKEVSCIRQSSKIGRYVEALAAADALATAAPGHRDALYLKAANQRCLNCIADALATLEVLEQHHPRFSLLHQERGYCYMTLRDATRAIEAFSHAVDLNPALATSWNCLERLLRITGATGPADLALEQISTLQRLAPEIVRAGSLLADGDFEAAESILRSYLAQNENHILGLQLLARVRQQQGGLHEAERLLETALNAAPDSKPVLLDYARLLLERQKYLQASKQAEALLAVEPDDGDCLSLSAAAHAGLGHHEQAIALYRRLLAGGTAPAGHQVALGHSLKTIGEQSEAITCYRSATELNPALGDAWWSLANLKTFRFSDTEIAAMQEVEAAAGTATTDRYAVCFALGKAYEDRNEFGRSWEFYKRGNALKRAESRYRPEIVEAEARKHLELCTADFFASRTGSGVSSPDPIFIVGLPRSGSTLIEQILASHSQVEGTQELADIPRMVAEFDRPPYDPEARRYPGVIAELAPDDLRILGERYLSDTRVYRSNKPVFIDKMPNNFRHIGLIHLILPKSRIIDVRREPLACCFSNLKQLFAEGQDFTYSDEDLGRYYRTYLELMRHWDSVLPGRVLRVFYEDVVDDVEGSVRRILDHCGLEFERGCVEFHRTDRSVRTPSSEQVRRPIFREALHQWQNYEPWLGPLKQALGDALACYRE